MKTTIDFKNILEGLHESEGEAFYADETAIITEHATQQTTAQSNFAVKMLSVVGGLFATIAFVGFLLAGGLYRSDMGLVLVGGMFIIAALAVHKAFATLLIDTACISFFCIGIFMLGVGLDAFMLGSTLIYSTFIAIGIVTVLIARHYLLTFLSVIIIAVSTLLMLVENGAYPSNYNMVHLFNFCITLILTYMMLHEAKIIAQSQKFAELFAPTRTALLLVLLMSLLLAQNINFHYKQTQDLAFLSTLPCAIGILYLISKILVILERNSVLSQIIVYSIAVILLALTALSPLISGALLVLLLCFYTNYKTGGALAIVALIYALSQYYYDLNLTLLQKSGILFGSGLLFLVFYFLTQRTFASDEKL